MNDMKPAEVLYNAFLACGIKPEREIVGDFEYIIHDVFVYVFVKNTGRYIETAIKKHHEASVIHI